MFKSVMSTIIMGALLLMAAGCSDDDSTTNPPAGSNETSHLELLDLQALVAAVAPPEFIAPVGTPTGVDSLGVWTTGDYPLLGKVFGSNDPQSLYRNINDFKRNLGILTAAVLVDANGDVVEGSISDSVMVEINGDSIMAHYAATVAALTDPTAIPVQSQAILGESVVIDYLVNITVDEMSGSVEQFGLTVNDSVQTLVQFHQMTETGVRTESNLVYHNEPDRFNLRLPRRRLCRIRYRRNLRLWLQHDVRKHVRFRLSDELAFQCTSGQPDHARLHSRRRQ
jgi:hypothetical protein